MNSCAGDGFIRRDFSVWIKMQQLFFSFFFLPKPLPDKGSM